MPLPRGHNAFAYVYEGSATLGVDGVAKPLARGSLAVLDRDGDSIAVEAVAENARLIVVAGKPLGEPVAKYGPFVMNTQDEIVQAMRDYQGGKF